MNTAQEKQVHKLVDDMLSLRNFALAPSEHFAGFAAKQKNESRCICGDCDCGMAGCDP